MNKKRKIIAIFISAIAAVSTFSANISSSALEVTDEDGITQPVHQKEKKTEESKPKKSSQQTKSKKENEKFDLLHKDTNYKNMIIIESETKLDLNQNTLQKLSENGIDYIVSTSKLDFKNSNYRWKKCTDKCFDPIFSLKYPNKNKFVTKSLKSVFNFKSYYHYSTDYKTTTK